jgi:hypothetical protein
VIADGGRSPAPKARAEGARQRRPRILAFLDVSVKHFSRKNSLPRRAPSARCPSDMPGERLRRAVPGGRLRRSENQLLMFSSYYMQLLAEVAGWSRVFFFFSVSLFSSLLSLILSYLARASLILSYLGSKALSLSLSLDLISLSLSIRQDGLSYLTSLSGKIR